MFSYLYPYHAELKASTPNSSFMVIALSVWFLIIRYWLVVFINRNNSVLYHLCNVVKYIQRYLRSDIEKFPVLSDA